MSTENIRKIIEACDTIAYEHSYKYKEAALKELEELEQLDAKLITADEGWRAANALLDSRAARVAELEAGLKALLPGKTRVTGRSVEAHAACGRWYLNVAGYVTVVQADVCRDPNFDKIWKEEDIKLIEEKFNAQIRALLEE